MENAPNFLPNPAAGVRSTGLVGLLKRPFPFETTASKRFLTAGMFGITITTILLLAEPFGLSRVQSQWKQGIIAFYGVITFVIMVFNYFTWERIFPRYFDEESWNVGKHISFTLIHVLSIGVANFLYSRYIFSLTIGIQAFINFLLWTALIGLVPIVVLTLVLERKYWKTHVERASKITSGIEERKEESAVNAAQNQATPKLIVIFGSSQKEQYELNPASILCIQAGDNYVTLFYESSESIKKILFRATLKSLEEQLQHRTEFFRCHKSYIVQLPHVEKVSGNAQGYKLHLPLLDFVVPVSRSLQNDVLDKLHHLPRS
ncbi:MAG: LytTR family transcriptional regulator [Candidatus Kapaibacterium sp.]|nr:MAG: LytTR family transcriptional regulator [Candidatus Kapabacteria bacterium]